MPHSGYPKAGDEVYCYFGRRAAEGPGASAWRVVRRTRLVKVEADWPHTWALPFMGVLHEAQGRWKRLPKGLRPELTDSDFPRDQVAFREEFAVVMKSLAEQEERKEASSTAKAPSSGALPAQKPSTPTVAPSPPTPVQQPATRTSSRVKSAPKRYVLDYVDMSKTSRKKAVANPTIQDDFVEQPSESEVTDADAYSDKGTESESSDTSMGEEKTPKRGTRARKATKAAAKIAAKSDPKPKASTPASKPMTKGKTKGAAAASQPNALVAEKKVAQGKRQRPTTTSTSTLAPIDESPVGEPHTGSRPAKRPRTKPPQPLAGQAAETPARRPSEHTNDVDMDAHGGSKDVSMMHEDQDNQDQDDQDQDNQGEEHNDEDEDATQAPRVDKGKGRAVRTPSPSPSSRSLFGASPPPPSAAPSRGTRGKLTKVERDVIAAFTSQIFELADQLSLSPSQLLKECGFGISLAQTSDNKWNTYQSWLRKQPGTPSGSESLSVSRCVSLQL